MPDSPFRCDDEVGSEVDEQPVGDDSGSCVESSRQLGRPLDRTEVAVEDEVALVSEERVVATPT